MINLTDRLKPVFGLTELLGDSFPVPVVFKKPISNNDRIEPGMRGMLIGAEIEDGPGDKVRLFFWLGDHIEFNRKMVRESPSTHARTNLGADWCADRYSVLIRSTAICSDFLANIEE